MNSKFFSVRVESVPLVPWHDFTSSQSYDGNKLTNSFIQSVNSLHFLLGQFKVKNLKVFFELLLNDAFRNRADSFLSLPSQYRLGSGFVILFRNFLNDWIHQDV